MATQQLKTDTIFIIDGNAYIHRAYHAIPPLTTSRGEPVNAVYGFLRMIWKIIHNEKPEYLTVCFDYPAPTFRHKQFPEYKATRKEIDEELKSQMPLAKQTVSILGLSGLEKEGYEADDLIGALAKKAETKGLKVVIVTGDKDALQLVNENTCVLNEHKNILYDIDKVVERYGVKPEQLTDVFGLCGDTSDNIPGVPGVGEKTATKLIQEYGSLANLLKKVDSLPLKQKQKLLEHKDKALLSKQLVTIDTKAPLELSIKECQLKKIEPKKVIPFLQKLEFTRLLNEMELVNVDTETEKVDYKIILNETKFYKMTDILKKSKKISIDLETTGVNPFKAEIVGISISVQQNSGWYIPIKHDYLGAPEQLNSKLVLSVMKPILENQKIKKYGQNIKYDLLCLRQKGINLQNIFFDTMIASYCLNPSRKGHNLKNLSLDYLQHQMTPIESLIGKKGIKQTTMDKIEIDRVGRYSCADADIVLRLSSIMEKSLAEKEMEKLFFQVEMPLVSVLADMETTGIKVDIPYFKKVGKEFKTKMAELEKEIYKIANMDFNLNSPKQLAFVLFEKLQLPKVRRTKKGGGFSTDEEVLRTLSSNYPENDPKNLPKKLIQYRELQKLKSTYIDSIIELAEPKTSRLHTSFNQTVTSTGRLSSSEPNLQNIPIRTETGRKIRQGFIPEKEHIFISADYSQIDLRVMAHVSQDKILCEAFNKGDDIHIATATEIFGIKPGEVTTELRRVAKTINFGIIYGMSSYGLVQQLNISRDKAQGFIDNYFKKYSGVKSWIENTLKKARKEGSVTTLLNRIRYLPEINSKNDQIRAFAERTAINTPIQGSAADIIKIAMLRIKKKLESKNLNSKMLLQVHDDLLFEVENKEVDVVVDIVKKEMENVYNLSIPLVVDIKKGKNWNELK